MSTAAQGKKGRNKTHIRCRRCGRISYHKKRNICSSCGYGKSARRRCYSWQVK